MSLETKLTEFAQAVGVDIKALKSAITGNNSELGELDVAIKELAIGLVNQMTEIKSSIGNVDIDLVAIYNTAKAINVNTSTN
jgi:hypothetical protein